MLHVHAYLKINVQWNIKLKINNEILPFTPTWMDLEGIILTEIR